MKVEWLWLREWDKAAQERGSYVEADLVLGLLFVSAWLWGLKEWIG